MSRSLTETETIFETDFQTIKSLDLDPPDYELLANPRVKKLMQLAYLTAATNGIRDAGEMLKTIKVRK